MGKDYFAITPELCQLAQKCRDSSSIDGSLYTKYEVKRGLRDINGKGVLTGLTEISEIVSSKMVDGKSVPCEGKLYYRGIDVEEIVNGFLADMRKPLICCFLGSFPTGASWNNSGIFLGNTVPCPPASSVILL